MEIWGMDVMVGPLLDIEDEKRKWELNDLLQPYMYFSTEEERWVLPEELPDAVEPFRKELEKLEAKEEQLYKRLEKEGPFPKRKRRGPGRYKKR